MGLCINLRHTVAVAALLKCLCYSYIYFSWKSADKLLQIS